MFTIALSNVILTLFYAIPGFALCKSKKATAKHLPTLSAVLVYICSPCMIISAFLGLDYRPEDFKRMGIFFVITLVLQSAFMLILRLIFAKSFSDSKYRMLTIGSVMGNVGFFGLPIIRAMLPESPEAACYSAVYVLSMNMLVFTAGVFCLTGDKKFMSVKNAFINPSSLAAVVAIPLYISGTIILGIRLAEVDFKSLSMRPFVYLTCACKLLVYPLFCYGAVYFLPLDAAFKASVLILSSVPCASIILNLAEMHKSETELAANSVLLSTLICFITIPLLALLI